jgi:hypothetical protein
MANESGTTKPPGELLMLLGSELKNAGATIHHLNLSEFLKTMAG